MKENVVQQARALFEDSARGINITIEGRRLLGAALGTEAFVTSFIAGSVTRLTRRLLRLAEFAKSQPHAIASNAMTLHTIFCCLFGAKNFALFLQVDLFDWEHSSFCRFSSETFFFKVHIFVTHPHKHFSRSITKNAIVMCTDLRTRFFTPRRTAPLAPSHFFSKFRFWPTSKAKFSSPNSDGQDAHYGLASLSHRHGGKEDKRLSKRSPSSENARKDQKKKRQHA